MVSLRWLCVPLLVLAACTGPAPQEAAPQEAAPRHVCITIPSGLVECQEVPPGR